MIWRNSQAGRTYQRPERTSIHRSLVGRNPRDIGQRGRTTLSCSEGVRMRGREHRSADRLRPVSICDLLALLGGEIRLEILTSLGQSAKHVTALADELELSLGMVSHNLGLLREHGLVNTEHDKKHRIYRLSDRASGLTQAGCVQLAASSTDGGWLLVGHPARNTRSVAEPEYRTKESVEITVKWNGRAARTVVSELITLTTQPVEQDNPIG